MKFLIDMPLSFKLAQYLRERGYDAYHISERGLQRASDEEIFELAVKEQRIIIPADIDFSRIFALCFTYKSKSGNYGLILFREGTLSDRQMLEFLQRVLDSVPSEKIQRSIVVVEHHRIRITPLPL